MTFSIVARSEDGSHLGVAVASKFVAVGAVVPAAEPALGALATQAFANLAYRPDGLAHLAAGRTAQEALDALVAADDGREQRQAGVVDASGASATYTGAECMPWAGGRTGPGYAIQGNILTGPEVVADMERAWLATDAGAALAERLLDVLVAGDAAGGDSRGRQSAAVLVVTPGGGYGGGSDALVDLRVDDHVAPIPELVRILGVHTMLFGSADPADCLPLADAVADEVRLRLAVAGFDRGDLDASLASWAGVENLEERLHPGLIDPVVLDHLRRTTPRTGTVSVLAVDLGTTGVTALLVGRDGSVLARGYQEFPQYFPQAGWVEHEPEEIWQAALSAGRQVLGAGVEAPTAVGITNQRETAVLWDRETLGAARRAIVWQDRRTTGLCEQLRADGHEEMVRRRTGLRLDPYFTATKLTWIATNEPHVWAQVMAGRVAIGTVDSYAIARMTRGLLHVTDASNASRTLLFDLDTGAWSPQLCELFGVPKASLPEIVPSLGVVGRTDPAAFLGLDLPVAGIAGDQQAALFGQTCFDPGSTKCTYGTGSFILTNTGPTPVRSPSGLLTTVAWAAPDGTLTYALEGAVFVTGAAVQWLRDGLQIVGSATEVEGLARTVPDSGGVVFVPALTGLGAPDWDPDARGLLIGVTRGTTRAHLARATLEAIAYEVRDVVDVMTREAGVDLPRLAVDGGAAANDLLCELQAAQLGVPVERPQTLETTGLGAAFLAGLGTGVWSGTEELRATWALDRRFEPTGPRDEAGHRRWRSAVERSKGWAGV